MRDLLDGRVALVTGGGRGIGRALALGLADGGAQVVVNDLGVSPDGRGTDPGPAGGVVNEVRAQGGGAVANVNDIATMAGGEAAVAAALNEFGRLDILVNAAGIFRHNVIFEMSESEWDDVLRVHLKGHFACLKAALPRMREQGWGRIINFASGVATNGLPAAANYGRAKGAIIGLSRAVAQEVRGSRITCNVIAPAAATRASVDVGREVNELRASFGLSSQTSARPLPDSEDIVPAVVYLCSEEGSRFNGSVLHLMGGHIQLGSDEIPSRSVTSTGSWTLHDLARALPAALLFDVGSSSPPPPPSR